MDSGNGGDDGAAGALQEASTSDAPVGKHAAADTKGAGDERHAAVSVVETVTKITNVEEDGDEDSFSEQGKGTEKPVQGSPKVDCLKKGIEFIQRACEHDHQGNYEEAFSCYKRAFGWLDLAIKSTKNPATKASLTRRMNEYLSRAEALKEYLEAKNQKKAKFDIDVAVDRIRQLNLQVTAWLKALDVGGVVALFRKRFAASEADCERLTQERIDGDVLVSLSKEELREKVALSVGTIDKYHKWRGGL